MVLLLVAITLGITTTVFALTSEDRPVQQSSLPQIVFLGEGPQTFTIEPPLKLLVKTYQNGVFLFVAHDEPSYQAVRGERVWSTNFVPNESIRLFDESRSYGNVPAGCVVNFVQIEDNIDARRNTFFINGNVLHVVEQGMVTYGTFTVPEAGELTFFAEDSIGMVVETCLALQTVVPSETPTVTSLPSATNTTEPPTATPTVTQEVSTETPTPTPTATEESGINTPTVTQTVPAQTSTATATLPTPGAVIEPSQTPSPTPTPTNTPPGSVITVTATQPSTSPLPTNTATAILITATPISTPGAIPITGGEPGPREIAVMSAVIFGIFGLVAAAWWFLLRAYRDVR